MRNCEILVWYGALVLIVMGVAIIVPYLRRKAELLSAWNILLLGVAIFIGIGCLEAASTPLRFPGLQWFEPTPREVSRFLVNTTAFLIALFAFYYYDPVSKAVAGRCLNNWPPLSTGTMLYVIAVCFVLAMAYLSPQLLRITFVGPVVLNVSHKAFVFVTLFSFVLWYRNKLNLVWLGLFIVLFLSMCMMSMLAGHGRRILLSVFIAPVLVVYYYSARQWRPTRAMVVVAVGTLAIFTVNLMYNSIRRYDWGKDKQERSAAGLAKQIRDIGNRNWFERFASDSMYHLSQQVVHYGLLTDHYVQTGQLEPSPLNTFRFMIVYPIPRRIWPDKPQILATIITRDVVGFERTNWGTGVAGQSAYEGGWIVAMMFGYMAAFGVRIFDDPLRRQPKNPFLIAMLAAAAPHLLAWPRGDLFTMTAESAECVFFAVALGISGRIFFGTERAGPPVVTSRASMRPTFRGAVS
jgi:hypothetical protein